MIDIESLKDLCTDLAKRADEASLSFNNKSACSFFFESTGGGTQKPESYKDIYKKFDIAKILSSMDQLKKPGQEIKAGQVAAVKFSVDFMTGIHRDVRSRFQSRLDCYRRNVLYKRHMREHSGLISRNVGKIQEG